MDKLTYLKLAIKKKQHHQFKWAVYAFNIVDDKIENKEPYSLSYIDNQYYYYNPEINDHVKVGSKTSNPLFTFNDIITVDNTWIQNLNDTIESTIGNLLVNEILLVSNFGVKIPYINGPISIGNIEIQIASKLSDISSPDNITVTEYEKFVKAVTYIKRWSQFAVISSTVKTIVAAPGIEKFRNDLIKEYKDDLNDPSKVTEIEQRLKEYDNEYLKDDPTFNKFLSGKIKDISRKKLYLIYGTESNFNTSKNKKMIEKPLIDGWSDDPEDIVTMFNSIRSGSYSRGAETVKGGLAAKIILRASSNLKIIASDCGSVNGLMLKVHENTLKHLIGRTIITNDNDLKKITNMGDAKQYLNTAVLVRSPQYCILPNEEICNVCAGDKLSIHDSGVSLAITEISSIILNSSMKAMHGKVLEVKELVFEEAFS